MARVEGEVAGGDDWTGQTTSTQNKSKQVEAARLAANSRYTLEGTTIFLQILRGLPTGD